MIIKVLKVWTPEFKNFHKPKFVIRTLELFIKRQKTWGFTLLYYLQDPKKCIKILNESSTKLLSDQRKSFKLKSVHFVVYITYIECSKPE